MSRSRWWQWGIIYSLLNLVHGLYMQWANFRSGHLFSWSVSNFSFSNLSLFYVYSPWHRQTVVRRCSAWGECAHVTELIQRWSELLAASPRLRRWTWAAVTVDYRACDGLCWWIQAVHRRATERSENMCLVPSLLLALPERFFFLKRHYLSLDSIVVSSTVWEIAVDVSSVVYWQP